MRKVATYKCDYCGEMFFSEESCLEHENKHVRAKKVIKMLNEGKTFKEIRDECGVFQNLSENLYNENIFTLP